MMGIGFELSWYVIFTFNFFIAFCGADWFYATLDYIDECFEDAGGYIVVDFFVSNYKSLKIGGAMNHRPVWPVRWLIYGRDDFLFDYYTKYERQVQAHMWRALAEIERAHRKLDQADLNEIKLFALASSSRFLYFEYFRSLAGIHFPMHGIIGTLVYAIDSTSKEFYVLKYLLINAAHAHILVDSVHFFITSTIPFRMLVNYYSLLLFIEEDWPRIYQEWDDWSYRCYEETILTLERWHFEVSYFIKTMIPAMRHVLFIDHTLWVIRGIPQFVINLPQNTIWFCKTVKEILIIIYRS